MKPIAIFLAEKLEDIVSNENWLLVNNAADELRRLQAKVEQLEAAQPSKPWVGLTDEEIEARAINFYNPEMYKRAVLWAQEKLKERNQ